MQDASLFFLRLFFSLRLSAVEEELLRAHVGSRLLTRPREFNVRNFGYFRVGFKSRHVRLDFSKEVAL